MNIGIIVYSQSGNTFSVAKRLKEKLDAAGHTVAIEKISSAGDVAPRAKNVELQTIPDTAPYDALVFASPVQAFALMPVMAAYLKQLPSLQNKKAALFVTKQLPYPWTGGNQAIAKMKELCGEKEADIIGSEIVIWSKTKREENIARCVDNLCSMF